MQTNRPTKDQWHDWYEHPVTSAYFEALKSEREEALQQLANGVFASEPNRQNIAIGLIAALTKQLNAEIVGNE